MRSTPMLAGVALILGATAFACVKPTPKAEATPVARVSPTSEVSALKNELDSAKSTIAALELEVATLKRTNAPAPPVVKNDAPAAKQVQVRSLPVSAPACANGSCGTVAQRRVYQPQPQATYEQPRRFRNGGWYLGKRLGF